MAGVPLCETLEAQRMLAENYGVQWEWWPRERVRESIASERYSDALFERNALHLHPLNYVTGLARAAAEQGLSIHEHSGVHRIQREGAGWCIRTETGDAEI